MSHDPEERPLVVYVDDEIPNLTVFQAAFGDLFNVAVCKSAEEAVGVMSGQTVAVVLADQRMPNETGVNLLTRVKDLHPDAIRVLVTAYADHEPMVQAVNRVQIDRFIPKPWENREMEGLIRGAIDAYYLRLRVRGLEMSLVAAQRIDTLGRLAASLVHDMASPLAAITANIERLRFAQPIFQRLQEERLNKYGDEAEILSEMGELTSDLEMSTQYIIQLVNGIREHWRPTAADGAADVKAVVEFSRRLLTTRARNERVTLAIGNDDVPKVAISPSALCQVVTNLLGNALQAFTPTSVRREVRLVVGLEGDGVSISVTDTGRGIPEEVLQRLGREQVTTKALGQGTGLGVLTSRTLVERAGGRFKLESTMGEGTRARVWLPLAPQPRRA